jgi:hypothetical protein
MGQTGALPIFGFADAMESEERVVCGKPGLQAGFAGTVAWRKSNEQRKMDKALVRPL